jgi:hypothetical protein
MAAVDPTDLATSSGWRNGVLSTLVTKPMRSVAAAMAGMATSGSTKGVSGAQNRAPSPLNGYDPETSSG